MKNLLLLSFILIMSLAHSKSSWGFFSRPSEWVPPKEFQAHDIVTNKSLKWSLTNSPLENKLIGTVITFLSTKCPCSNSHLPHLLELQKDFPQFSFIGIHSDKMGKKGDVQAFFKEKKVTFPVLLDSKLKLANAFKAIKTPHVFVINSEGQLLFHGGLTNSANFKFAKKLYLREALNKIKRKEPLEKLRSCYRMFDNKIS